MKQHQTDAVLSFPSESAKIPVGRRAESLFFLHTATFAHEEAAGTTVWEYEVSYADGARELVPVRALIDVADSTYPLAVEPPIAGHPLGTTEEWLYVQRWDNPHPGREIDGIVVRSRMTKTAGILVALATGHADAPR